MLMCLMYYYLLNFIALFLKVAENGFSKITYNEVFMGILMPFFLMLFTYFAVIPSIIFMLVLTLCRVKMMFSFWLSMVCYLLLIYFVFKEEMNVSCVTSTVISGGVVTAIFWKTCKRLDEERRVGRRFLINGIIKRFFL